VAGNHTEFVQSLGYFISLFQNISW